METQQWLILVVVGMVVAVIVYRKSLQTRDSREQTHRMSVQAQGQAQSPAEEISQREDRRLAGMSVEDRAWETDALRRHQANQDRDDALAAPRV
jgi:hypothetical protein